MLFLFLSNTEERTIVELREIVSDYELNFHGKTCVFETGYKNLPEFEVRFDILDLFHILGIHKLNTGMFAKNWVQKVKENTFSIYEYRKQNLFRDSLTRIQNYDFFYEIFYQDKVKICILDKDLTKNTMKLSVIFYKTKEAKTIVIGLRKTSQGHYVPVTLHENRNNPYKNNKTTIIKAIEWQ